MLQSAKSTRQYTVALVPSSRCKYILHCPGGANKVVVQSSVPPAPVVLDVPCRRERRECSLRA
jgi:hypothetical protein